MAKNIPNSFKIKRLPYSRLLKAETADYSERIIAIIEEHKPKSIFINQLFNRLKKKEGDIHLLRLNYGVDTERLKAKNQKDDMLLSISMFKLKAKMIGKTILESELQMLNNAINTFLRNLHKCKNDKVLNQKVSGFFDSVANNKELAETIGKYNLNGEVEQVYESHKMFNSIVKKRIKNLSQRPNVVSRAISKDLLNRITHLFQGVELAYIVSLESGVDENMDEDMDEDMDSSEELGQLLKTLNQLSVMFYKSVKLREHNNQRKALVENEMYDDIGTANDTLSAKIISTDEEPSTISCERVDNDDKVDELDELEMALSEIALPEIAPSEIAESNARNDCETLLLRCDPQKEIDNILKTKAFCADTVHPKLIEYST